MEFPDSFSILVELLVAASQGPGATDLVAALSGPGRFTIYAPTNDAFAKLPEGLVGFLKAPANVDVLRTVLLYHVSSNIRDPRLTFRPREVKTLQGQTVFYNRDGKTLQINQSNADCQIVRTSNGKIVIIDSVLLPQF
ncbi:MAG: fasciclin domain-containing protein [Gammaproteobacteria bacterium]|jgi:uncharacterized surface protein with fasciclin (FAS1) repeats|nr:fasciclin domain-containing protein [Gammaproteobacteria bacterium]